MSRIVVADMYQLAKFDGAFDKKNKKLKRSNAKITEDYFEITNSQTEQSGILYVKNDEATKAYYEASQDALEKREAIAAKKRALANSAIAEIVEEKPKQKTNK